MHISDRCSALNTGSDTGVWLCGAKDSNAIVINVEDGHEGMTVGISIHRK